MNSKKQMTNDPLVASFSHEFRTPLNAIIGYTGTLLMQLPGPLTSEQENQLQIIQRSARKLLSLVEGDNEIVNEDEQASEKIELRETRNADVTVSRRARILVIEDDPANLKLLSYLLQSLGHDVLTATDGQNGLDTATQAKPDLILCDIMLPKLSGFEIAQRVRLDPAIRHIPLIAITGSENTDEGAFAQNTFDDYIRKPIKVEHLVSRLRHFVERISWGGQGHSRHARPPAM